ncbi:MAG: hypothetical protein AAGH92_12555 [Planctomycetota bacterium]
MRYVLVAAVVGVGGLTIGPAMGAAGQSLQERVEAVRLERARAAALTPAPSVGPSLDALLERRMSVDFNGQTFDDALRAWSRDAGVALLINRPAWDNLGVDRSASVTMRLEDVPAAQALLILLDVGSDLFEFVAEPMPGSRPGLQIRTKQEANRAAFVRVYDVQDLVMEVPTFDDAPSMSLGEALGGSASSGGGGGGIFEDADDDEEPNTLQERGDALAETIRQTVEPDLWRANGGDVAAVRFRGGRLIVRAPGYVHAQIAGGSLDGRPGHVTRRPASPVSAGDPDAVPIGGAEQADGVSSVSSNEGPGVAGVAEP